MRRHLLATGAGLLVAGIATAGIAVASTGGDPASERQREARYTDQHRADAAVSQAEAERTALAAHAGTVGDVHLENEGGGLRWEVKPDDGRQVWEVQVDAASGKVVSDQPDE